MPAPCRHASRIAVALVVCGAAAAAIAADNGGVRGGGLVPSPRKTREELFRAWDLNSDGKIDQGEAEIAAARMRRERADLRLNSGIDPVTGQPRGQDIEPDPDAPESEPEPMEEPAAEDVADPDESPRLPGSRPTGTRLPQSRTPRARVGPNTGTTAEAEDAERPARTGVNAGMDVKRQAVTGGVRAGGMAARPGYGAGVPAPSLNAGLPIPPKGRAAVPPPTSSRAGTLPGSRPAVTPPRPTPVRPPVNRGPYDPY